MKKRILTMLLVLAMTLALAACKPGAGQPTSAPSQSGGEPNAAPVDAPMLADFSAGAVDAFFASDGWSNGSVFNVWWKGDMVTYSDHQLHLGISDANGEVEQGYYGGEARTGLYYGYGDYIVKMKPAKVDGTASTFFTCTGPYDINAEGNPNPWDEIDIEFLGKDTTGVQFNYFVNGQGGHEHWYDLGFDASEEFHEYGFRWKEDSISWLVDGKEVYTVEASADNPLPSTPGRILMNYWCGTPDAEGWMGKYEVNDTTADYQWVKTSARGRELVPAEGGDENGTMDGLDVNFADGAAADGSVFASDGWSNGSVFNVWWKGDMVTYSDNQLHLGISDAKGEVEQGYYGGEARTAHHYGYGEYSVSMKPAKVEGTASTFFTCTGNYDIGPDGNPNPWDEIDIEFLGKDTTGVQFNYFVDGQGGHEYWYDLGFDASEEFHEYGFRWAEDSITWTVDGKDVYTVSANADTPLPSTPGRILMNYWCGTPDAEGWMGKYQLSDATADYQWIKTTATGVSLGG